jgi:ribonuclease-3
MIIEESALKTCQKVIGYRFKDHALLEQALTHAFAADSRILSNERLEFLGDAILGMVICHELYRRFPEYLEGELTKIKSMIVSRRTCAEVAYRLDLTGFLITGKGMAGQRSLPSSCTAAAVEALIGAVFLDGGEKSARKFILMSFGPLLDEADAEAHQGNFKSILQQFAQHHLNTTPSYELLDEKGPDHSKCFEVGVLIGSRRFLSGWGPSKKEAEQLAAFHALRELGVIAADTEFTGNGSGDD